MNATPYWNWTNLTRDVAAVTGACLAIRKDLFQQVGGFDQAFPVNYNDTDLCLRVRKAGYRVLFETGAVLLIANARLVRVECPSPSASGGMFAGPGNLTREIPFTVLFTDA